MSSILRDLRFALRMFVSNPAIAIVAVIALGLGIGVTTTMYSIVYGVLLRGLPVEEGQRIYDFSRIDLTDGDDMRTPVHDYLDWRQRQTSFEDLGAVYTSPLDISGTDGTERHAGAFVSANTFRILRVQPALGRVFVDGEDSPGAAPVVLLSHHLWRDRYGSDPSVVGRVIRANGEPTTVVGVMPEGFMFPFLQDAWQPLRLDPGALDRGSGTRLEVFGRLRQGVDLGQARAELDGIQAQIAAEFPALNENIGIGIQPYVDEYVGGEPRTVLLTALGAVFFVLAIACANVANLLVSRAFDRTKEAAIRSALGASRGRVASLMLLEAGLLAAAGSLVGIAISVVGVDWFTNAIAGTGAPYFIDIRVDAPVLFFVIGVTALAALLAGTLPAVQVTRSSLNEVLADESRGSSSLRMGRLSRGLVILQVALSCALLVAAGLMIRSVVNLGTSDYGFDPSQILTARVSLPEAEYPDAEARVRLFDELQGRLSDNPGSVDVALTTALPVSETANRRFRVEGESYPDEERPDANVATVTPGMFATFGISVLRGRDFNDTDTATGLPTMIVNETFVARYMDGRDPLGKRVALRATGDDEDLWRTIVGIVPDLYMDGPLNESPDGIYVPLAQSETREVQIAIRTRDEPLSFIPTLRRETLSVDPNLPLFAVQTMAASIEQQTWFYWVFGSLFGAFGMVALLLASVGLYGVMSFAGRRRRAEVGIRMALGAEAGRVLWQILRQGLTQVGIGLAIGLLIAGGLAQLMEVLLFQVEPTDPATFLSIALALLATGAAASLIPAMRAARVDPIIALRQQ